MAKSMRMDDIIDFVTAETDQELKFIYTSALWFD